MLHFILILLIVVPAILLAVTALLITNSVRKLRNYEQSTGVIERFHKGTSPTHEPGQVRISPVVSYTVDGRRYEFIGNYCSTWMKIGQEIEILYSKEDHSKATIKQGLYVAPMITGALTLLFTLALVIFLVLRSQGVIQF